MKDTKISRTARMFQLVLAGYSNEAAVEVIKKEYGKNVPTNTASIGWCRTQLKKGTKYAKKHNPRNLKVVSNRDAKIQVKGAKPAVKTPAATKPAAKDVKQAIKDAIVKQQAARASARANAA